MKTDEFFIKFIEILVCHKYQFDWQNESRVYIGLPNFDFSKDSFSVELKNNLNKFCNPKNY